MTNAEFRQAVKAALTGLLGQYVASDGSTFTAISDGTPLAPGLQVQGLEAVITATPDLQPLKEFGGPVGVRKVRTLILRYWGPLGYSLEPAMRRIALHFPNAGDPRVLPGTSETLAQVSYDIFETEDITA